MSLVLNEPLGGGQVPLLKHRIMQSLLEHQRGEKGHVAAAMNTYWFVEKTKASPPNVNRALWDLQKQGLITFRESKRAGTNGHANTTVLDRIYITPQGQAWKLEPAAFGDLGTRDWGQDDWDPEFKAEVARDDVVDDIQRDAINKRLRETARLLETTRSAHPAQCTCGHPIGTRLKSVEHLRGCPWAQQMEAMVKTIKAQKDALIAGTVTPEQAIEALQETEAKTKGPWAIDPMWTPLEALVALLRYEAPNPIHVKDANVRLGYDRDSVALYTLVKPNLDKIKRDNGMLSMLPGSEDWDPPHAGPVHRRPRKPVAPKPKSSPMLEEARASVALDHDTRVQTITPSKIVAGPDVVAIANPADWERYPLINALLGREAKRQKVAEAVAALEAAGLDDMALQAMAAVPDDTPLEREIVALVKEREW